MLNVEYHKRPKLTMRGVEIINIILFYAKRDSRLVAYGGVVLQRFVFIKICMGVNALEFTAKYNDILTIKSTYLNVLSLCLLLSRFSGRSEAF